ncbi:Nucleoporin nup44 [Sparassis crispa]|uniref:Nucleoporin nup44 n=1 Tax=Sparassis crispa TaxID=139825 RepID=A0A401GMB2_9APHY|nr:Nucleoporin nup44 [Sparassis crispa]GBE83336.1 Nucleoporin nup44 [Sparassis crispa]
MFGSFSNPNTSSGSAFGNASQQPQQAGTSNAVGLLGAPSAAPGSTSLFGGSAPQTGAGSNPLLGGNQGTSQSTAGGLFGNSANQGGGGLFGGTNMQNRPAAGAGLFGATSGTSSGNPLLGTAPQNPLGGTGTSPNPLFATGGSNTGTTGGGLFGNAPVGGNTAPAGGGLFGNPAGGSNTNTTGGLFGNAAGGSRSNTTGGGLLGSTTAGSNTNAPSSGLFGNTAGGTTGATSGGLFNNTTAGSSATAPGSGLFGNTTGTSAGNTGGGLFRSTTNSSTTGGGLFGAPPPIVPPSLFGSTQGQQQGSSSMLGQPPTSMLGQPPPSMLGQPPPSMLGQPPTSTLGQPPQYGSLFGNSGQSPAGGSLLGGSFLGRTTQPNAVSSGLLSRTAIPSSQQPADAQSQFASLVQRIESTVKAWDPASPQCRFQHYFYNLVDPSQVQLYGRPANATNDALWQKAIRENPDPSCLVPVIAIGFDDLQKRVEAQSQQATAQQERLKELQTRIAALSQRHQLSNASRLNRASMLQTQLTHRVLKLVQHLHLLIPTLRSSAIRPEEEALRTALEDIDQDIRRPGGTGRMRGKLNELWALIGAVNAARERDRKGGVVEWTVVDDEGLSQIAQILADEQAGLAHLTKILQRDIKDLAVIQGTSVKEEEPNALLTSASTLRGSTGY